MTRNVYIFLNILWKFLESNRFYNCRVLIMLLKNFLLHFKGSFDWPRIFVLAINCLAFWFSEYFIQDIMSLYPNKVITKTVWLLQMCGNDTYFFIYICVCLCSFDMFVYVCLDVYFNVCIYKLMWCLCYFDFWRVRLFFLRGFLFFCWFSSFFYVIFNSFLWFNFFCLFLNILCRKWCLRNIKNIFCIMKCMLFFVWKETLLKWKKIIYFRYIEIYFSQLKVRFFNKNKNYI